MLAFRAATAANVDALHQLIESAYRGDSAKRGWTHEADLLGGQRINPAMLMAIIEDPAQRLLVAEHEGALIGCVAVEARGDYGYVGLVTVDPAAQAGGIGRQLLAAAERHIVDALGYHRARMTVIVQRRELIEWYQRRGYIDTGERAAFPYGDPRFGDPVRNDLAFVVMEKPLA